MEAVRVDWLEDGLDCLPTKLRLWAVCKAAIVEVAEILVRKEILLSSSAQIDNDFYLTEKKCLAFVFPLFPFVCYVC